MPDLILDFSWTHPSVDELQAVGCQAIMVYITPNPQGQYNTPPQSYLEDCVGRGIVVCPIYETAGERANNGYDAGRQDGDTGAYEMERHFFPEGVRLWVNVADTPGPSPLEPIGQYARGFAETFPDRWRLGGYGNEGALYAALAGSPRFDAMWAVETWIAGGSSGSAEDHFNYWCNKPGGSIRLVQMANIPPPLNGTDTNWRVPGTMLGGWGEDQLNHEPTVQGWRYPLDGPMRVNSPWGPRGGSFHYGIDLWAMDGDRALAVDEMDCYYAASEQAGGNHLAFKLVRPPAPNVPKVGYMHLREFAVGPGDHVMPGDVVGYTDSTGANVSGPHLHFWCGDNANVGAVDPTPFLIAGPSKPSKPLPDFRKLAVQLTAMKGDHAMAMVLYGDYEVSFHVNAVGQLVHNSVNQFGQSAVLDQVLLENNDPNVQPAARVDHDNLIVTTVDAFNGRVRRISFVPSQGWVDMSGQPVAGIHPI